MNHLKLHHVLCVFDLFSYLPSVIGDLTYFASCLSPFSIPALKHFNY
jgi:hypothetical protein